MDDIRSISTNLNLPEDTFISQYLEKSEDEYLIAKKPCPFLKDNLCSIYGVRPEDCRSYPHLWKQGFQTRLIHVVENSHYPCMNFNVSSQ